MTVKKPDGTVLVSSTACGTSCWIDTKVLPADGTYTVLLDPQNWYTGSLTAQLFDVPADPVLTATVGGPGVPVATTTPGQNAKVTFTATTGQRVSVQIAGSTYGSSSSSVYASVLKPDGTTLVSSTGVGSGGVLLGPVTITADGVHTIVLDPSTDLVGGVTVTVNDTADATVATTVGGAPVTAATTTAGQNATVTFPVTDGARVAVKLTASTYGSSSGSLYASLLKPDGSVLVAATGVGSGGLFIDARLLSPAGTYKVLLDPQGALTGSVQVEVIGVPADVTAVAALDGSVTHVATTVAGQNAAVTFTGTAGQRVSTLLSNGTGSIYATISKPDGTDLYARWYAGSGSFADVVTLPADGAYTIKLDPSTVSLGTMDVQVWSVPADPSAVAAPDGTVATVAMAVPGQNGSVTVAGTAGQRFSFRLSGSVGVYATVKKPDGTDLYARWYASTSSFADPVTLPATGTYTVLLDPSGSATGSYSVQVYTVPADPAYAVGTDGTPVTASMGVPGQNASVTFSGTAGQRLSLLLSGTVSVYATVTRPDGTNLYNRWYAGTSSFTEPVVLPATGTYTILIDPSGSATGTTDVRAYTVPADVSVDIGQDGTPVTVSTGAPGQNGRATFTGAAGRRVYLKAEMLGTYKGSATVSLRDPANTSLTSSTVYGPTGSVVLGPVTLSAGGTFSLLVDPSTTSTGVMQLRLWDATPAPAVAATIGGPAVTVGTGVPGQSGLATFTGTAGQKVSAVVSAPTYAEDGAAAAFNGWLLGPTGTTLDSDYSYGSAMLLTATLPADGTYTVNARPVGLAVGTAQVRIYEIPADPVVAAVIGGGHFVLPIAVPGAGAVAAFTATAGQPIVLDLVDSPAEAYAVVTRPDGVTLCSGYVSVYSQLSCTAGAAGEYRARVTLYTADSGDVTLELVDGIGTPDIRSVIAGEWLGGDVSLEWSTTASVSIAGYAVTIDDSPATDPGTAVTQVQDYLDTVLGDGVHYVHVRAIATSGYAGPAGHLEIKVDATAPAAPVVAVPSHPDPDTGVASLAVHAQFTGTDATSGIAGYAVTVTHGADDEPLGGADATADYTTTLSAEGEWYLHVVAVDRAGNRSAAVHRRLTADMPPDAPRVTSPTHPVAGTAYAGQDFVATWQPGTADADRWAVVLDHSATTVPAVTSTSAETRFGAHLAGGTWWLHVRGVDTAGTPGATAHFEVVVAPQTLAFTAPLPGRVVWGAVPVTLDCPAGSALTVQARAAGGTWYPVGTAAESAGVCATTWTTTDAGWADGAYELRASDGTTVVVGGLNVTVTNASNVVDRIRFDYEAGALDMVNYVRYTLYAIVNPAAVPARYTDGAAELNETSGVLQALVGLFGELPAAVQDELRPWLSPTPADPPAGVQGGRSSARAKLLSNPDCGFWNRVGDVLFSCKATTAHFTVYYLEDNVGGTPPGKTRPDYVQTAMDNLEGARTAYQSNLGYRVPDHVEVIMHPVASWMHSGVSVPSFPLCGCGDGIMYLNEHANDIKDLVRHELFHFVQYEYISHLKAANNWMNWWMEATAEWGAHQAGYYAGEMGQDDSYYQSLDDFLKESDERFDEGNTVFQQGGPEYGAFIMAEFMEVRLGMDSIRWSWERLGGLFPPHPGDVIEELFNTMRVNGSFADEIERFRQWVYPVESFQSPVGFYDSDAHDWRGSLSSLPGFRPPHKLVTLNPDGGSIQLARGDLHIQQTGAQYVEVSNPNKFSTELGVTFAADDEDVRASILLLDENTFPSAACGDVTPVDGVQGTIVTLTAQCPNAVVVFVNTEAAGWWGTWSDGDYTLTYVRQSIDLSGVSDIGVGKYGNISSANGVGLRRHGQPDTESILNGCYCEGWGVGVPGQFGASVTDELGWKNMSLDSFTVNGPNTVTSIIDIPGGGLQVVQTTSPSSVGFLWAMRVTVFNTTSAPIGPVHYRRAVDWDPLPDLFQSYNTVQKIAGTDTTYVAGVSNDGFADPDPSFPMTDLGATGWFTDFGPDDTGALIDLNLGTLQPGEGKPFTIFYGTATSEAEAISGAQAAGAQVYSLGEVDTPQGRNQGLPYTPVMAVDGHSLNPAPLHALRSIPADGKTPAQTFLPTLPGTRPPHQGGA
ncbi:hypothetical protein [Hamadaea tsunoensis]|uniref:hypothetical protein n=1 Tax=Hamadaea tsunoensis TaxID=53368 RepID=UPI0003F9915D|nr:hypothetical protein [Hamadaea tsunoensis]